MLLLSIGRFSTIINKCKVKYIELKIMKVVLIRVILEKIMINVVLKSKMNQYFCNLTILKIHII